MEILVVDDSKEICLLVESILLSEGYDVESCCNPLEFNSVLSKSKPKVIITDLLMSGIDGRTLTNEVRNNPETKDIKIMIMSAHPDAPEISKNIGVDDFLSKPFEIDDLVQKVEQLMK